MGAWTRSRWIRLGVAAGALVAAIAAAFLYDRLLRARQPPHFDSEEDHFLFGSVGTESTDGVPYWIWLVLPRIFPDLLPGPGGYASLGILSRDGHEMPVGLSKVTIGHPRVGINCALCHAASVRTRPDEIPRLVAGAPAHQAAVQRYQRFLADAAADPRFTAGTILAEVARNYRLSAADRLLYRLVIVPATRRQLLRWREQSAGMDERPDWAHGRADLFNPLKVRRLGLPADDAVGTADAMPLWNMGQRAGDAFFWDGTSRSLRDAVTTAALAGGATRPWLDRDVERWDEGDAAERSSLRRVHDFIGSSRPPPYPGPIDQALAVAGEAVFARECAQCHAPEGARTGQPIPLAEIGTDAARLGAWTERAARAYDAFADDRRWAAESLAARDGYIAVPLDGVWLRAPYLHNGSVPSLQDLLTTPEERPAQFWRGYDVFDQVRVGFVYDGPDAQRAGSLHDTRLPGNGNGGHVFGTTLPEESKRALIEYLKTR